MQIDADLLGVISLGAPGFALVGTGIYLAIARRPVPLSAPLFIALGTVCLVLARPNGGQLNELTLDGKEGKIVVKFRTTEIKPESLPDATELKSSALRGIAEQSGNAGFLSSVSNLGAYAASNQYFDYLASVGFLAIPPTANRTYGPGDIVSVSGDTISVLQAQKAAFPNIPISVSNTVIPDMTFEQGGYSVRISCEDATIRSTPAFALKNASLALSLTKDAKIVSAVLHCGSFHVSASAQIGGGMGTTIGGRDVGLRLVAIEAIAETRS